MLNTRYFIQVIAQAHTLFTLPRTQSHGVQKKLPVGALRVTLLVIEKLVDIVHFLHLEIHEAFGNPNRGGSKPLQNQLFDLLWLCQRFSKAAVKSNLHLLIDNACGIAGISFRCSLAV
ncbi:hypothetical protein Ahy_A06g029296 isoform B [Arachis hypogaea]|uniref:Uncharacterized protein n=1 Tax=Arachis hypogaea TaxID=3818 RepID=A0A445CSV1_ARAHY|nr:hypothetical protein Ahy_A06g029296 isoform B [Arachis hypogaea]